MRSGRGTTADSGRKPAVAFLQSTQPVRWEHHGVPDELVVCALVVFGRPVPKARARIAGHAFTPERTQQAETRIKVAFKTLYAGARPAVERLGIRANFYFAGIALGDWDNYAKLVQDSLNKLAYKDDRQVREVSGIKVFEHAGGPERTEFVIYRAPAPEMVLPQ